MSLNLIPIPSGFFKDKSYIKWLATMQVRNGGNSPDATFKSQFPLYNTKMHEVVQPHPNGGVVSLIVYISYSLWKSEEVMGVTIPIEVESDTFSFACDWTYSYSKGQVIFGPAEKMTSPGLRSSKLLQGSCEDIQSKDQVGTDVRPFVYCTAQLGLKSQPGETNGWTLQLPFVGGPAYTPPGGAPTPDGGFKLGAFTMELDVKVPEHKIDLKTLQLTLVFEHERQPDISERRFGELKTWIDSLKHSNLFPVIKNRYLPIHIRGHSSKPGSPLSEDRRASLRRTNVQTLLLAHIEANAEILVNDRGNDDANPVDVPPNQRDKVYLYDRNVTIYIDEIEAKAALRRYYMEGNK